MFTSKYFNVGKVVCTHRINNTVAENKEFAKDVISAIGKFVNKDWGDLCEEDKQANEEALNYPEDLYLLASYHTCVGKIWIITNRASEKVGDNVTTVLFPDEK